MTNLEQDYNDLLVKRKEVLKEITDLMKNKEVSQYIKLQKENADLEEKQADLYRKVQIEKYENCDHILICSRVNHDSYEGRSHAHLGCIKCGLDTSILSKIIENGQDIADLSFDQQIMYEYLEKLYEKNIYLINADISILCNLELAQAIYKKIEEKNPGIDDYTAIKYFEIALDNIRYKPVSEERQTSRAKRLGLSKNFKSWNTFDVHRW